MTILQQIWQYIVALIQQWFPPNVTPGKQVTLKDLILAYNKPIKVMYPPVIGTVVNAEIDKVSDSDALKIAVLITSHAARVGLDWVYLAACIMQESRFSLTAFNRNLSQSNPTPSFQRTDWGPVQLSGTYLPSKPGMSGLSEDAMAAKACTAEYAIPLMADLMLSNIIAARMWLKSDTVLANATKALNTTMLSHEQFLATLFFNRGQSNDEVNKKGGRYYVLHRMTDKIKHPYRVATWYDDFTLALKSNNASGQGGINTIANRLLFALESDHFAEHEPR